MGTVTELRAPAPRLLHGIDHAAERLDVSRTVLYGLLRNDVIPSVLIGGKRLIAEADLQAYVDQLRADAAPYADTAS